MKHLLRTKLFLFVIFLPVIFATGCGIEKSQEYSPGVTFHETDPFFFEIDWANDSRRIVGATRPLQESGFLIGSEPSEIYVWDPNTNVYTQVSDETFSKWNENPVWHPQKDEIFYFSTQEFGEDYKIGKIDIETGEKTNLLPHGGSFDVMSDGITLVQGLGDRLFVGIGLNVESTWFAGSSNLINEVALSADDAYIAVATYDVDANLYSLYKVTVGGKAELLLLESHATLSQPAWSSDGQWILVQQGRYGVLALASDGSCITSQLPIEGSIDDISWSPDGKQVALATVQNQKLGILIIQTDSDFFRNWLLSGSCFTE